MKRTSSIAFLLVAMSIMVSCGPSDDDRIVVCTKDECCCPDSVVIDMWDGQLGLTAVKPVVLKDDAKWDAINSINAAPASKLGFEEADYVQYVIRAWYGSINPRVFKIRGSFVREYAYQWYDTGVQDFGKKLYEGVPITK